MLNQIKEEVQNAALDAWVYNGKIGTVELSTGVGKTFVFFKACLTMPKGSNILFLAETTVREQTVLDDAKAFHKFFGVNPLAGHNFKFSCYQTAYKYSISDYYSSITKSNTLICLDEIHDCLSTEYFKFIQNSNLDSNKIPRLGLSATIDRKTLYDVQGVEITKFDLLKTFCPVVYTYSLQSSIDNKTTRVIKFFVLKNKFDSVTKNTTAGAKGNTFQTTEALNYAYLDKAVREVMFMPAKDAASKKAKEFRIIQTATKRARFLYSLPSKIKLCKELLAKLPGKTLVFGQESKSLLQLCPNAIVSANKNYLRDLENFKAGKTLQTASNRILKQGENIPHLDNIILFAYYSKVKDFVQMVGRLRSDKNIGNVIVFVTTGSQEEKWFESMTSEMNVTFIECDSVNQLLTKL